MRNRRCFPIAKLLVYVVLVLRNPHHITTCSADTSGWFGKIPWQPQTPTHHFPGLDESRYEDLPPTVFAPGGRLYSVERALRDVHKPSNTTSNLVVAMQYRDGIVVVSTMIRSPFFYFDAIQNRSVDIEDHNDNIDSFVDHTMQDIVSLDWQDRSHPIRPPFVQLDRQLWAITAGPAPEGQIVRLHQLGAIVDDFRREYYQVPRAAVVARRIADQYQVLTQKKGATNGGSILPTTCLIVDNCKNRDIPSSIWRVDPNGQFWQCHAVVVGRGATAQMEQEFMDFLTPTDGKMMVDIEHQLRQLTMEESLTLATKLIRQAFLIHRQRNSPSSEAIYMQALVLNGGVQFMSHSEIQALVQRQSSVL